VRGLDNAERAYLLQLESNRSPDWDGPAVSDEELPVSNRLIERGLVREETHSREDDEFVWECEFDFITSMGELALRVDAARRATE
jgi:hypothetical protein